jgi:helicase
MERAQLFRRYVLGVPEDVASSFQHRDLPTWTLRLLSQVRGVRAEDIPSLLVNTFGGYTASRANPQWVMQVQRDIGQLVERLLHAGIAEPQGDHIHLTLLGRACGSSSLSFKSSLRLVELMKDLDVSAYAVHVVALVQVLDELDTGIYTPIVKRTRVEQMRVSQAVERYGHHVALILQRYCREQYEYWARCKRAALLFDWIEGVPVEEIERRYSKPFGGAISYGNITGIAEATRFHLRSAYQILAALFPDRPEFLQGVDEILGRLEFGLPLAVLPLARLSVPLTRGQCLALWDAGVGTLDALNALSGERLRDCVGPLTAAQLRPTIKGAA